MKLTLPIGLGLFLLGLYLAFIQHSPIWYTPYLIGGFLSFEGIKSRTGFSVLKYPRKFVLVWLIFLFIAVVVELTGNYLLDLWNYPSFGMLDYFLHVILIGYAFTLFSGLGFFVFLQNLFPSRNIQIFLLPIAAFLFGYVNEYPNTFAHEWVYVNWPLGEVLGIPILVSILWVALLAVLLLKSFYIQRA